MGRGFTKQLPADFGNNGSGAGAARTLPSSRPLKRSAALPARASCTSSLRCPGALSGAVAAVAKDWLGGRVADDGDLGDGFDTLLALLDLGSSTRMDQKIALTRSAAIALL